MERTTGLALVIVAGLCLGVACGTPRSTVTGIVHYLDIGSSPMSQDDVVVGVGDEVVWVNRGAGTVSLHLPGWLTGGVSCQRGFGEPFDGTTLLMPGRSASLCFAAPGTVPYRVSPPQSVDADAVARAVIHVTLVTADRFR